MARRFYHHSLPAAMAVCLALLAPLQHAPDHAHHPCDTHHSDHPPAESSTDCAACHLMAILAGTATLHAPTRMADGIDRIASRAMETPWRRIMPDKSLTARGPPATS